MHEKNELWYGVMGEKEHAAFWKNSRAKAVPEVASIDWSQKLIMYYQNDRIIGRGCRRSVRTTANVARVDMLICSYGVAPSI